MNKPLLTIVIPTLGRDMEFMKFLISLQEQNVSKINYAETVIEVIVVDQNQDDRVSKHINSCPETFFKIHNLKLEKKGLSNAKNAGLEVALGKYICFLDDDCWLEKNTITELLTILKSSVTTQGYLISILTPNGTSLVPHSLSPNFMLTKKNIEDSFFIPQIGQIYPTAECKQLRGFNLRLGVGTDYGSAEDTDMLVRLVMNGISFEYLHYVVIRHPEVNYQSMTADKCYAYGLGFGAFCKIHGWTRYWRYKMFRSFCATILYALFEPKKSSSYWATFKGRLNGYRTWEILK